MKKFVTLLLAMTVTVVSAFAQIASGTADECKWTITDGGELIIEPSNGTQGILGGWEIRAPWLEYTANISSVTVSGNVSILIASDLFSNCTNMRTADLSGLSTAGTMDLSRMFYGCSSLSNLKLGNFTTQDVVMNDLFTGCTNLRIIETTTATPPALAAGTFSTLPVTNCKLFVPEGSEEAYRVATGWSDMNLAVVHGVSGTCVWSIDEEGKFVIEPKDGVSGTLVSWSGYAPWHDYAEQVTSAQIKGEVHASTCYGFFRDFKNMVSADLRGLKTENVSDMRSMFSGCSSLTTLDLSNFNTQNVTYMRSMFSGCSSLTTLDLSNFNTHNVTDMSSMFSGCSSLTTLDLSNFNTQNVTNMRLMFANCSSLTTLDLSNFNTQNVTTMYSMFFDCSGLTTLDLSNFNTKSVTDMTQMFYHCSGLTTLNLSNFDTQNVTKMSNMFYSCSGLTTLDLSNFNTQNVTEMDVMFYSCSSLTTLDLSNFNTQNVTNMRWMFANCSSLTTLNLSNFNTQNVTEMDFMFYSCSSLTSLNLSNFNTQNVTNMQNMFYGSSNLASIISDNAIPSTLQAGTFSTLPTQQTCQLYVPGDAKEAYSTAAGWNELNLATAYGTIGSCVWSIDKDGKFVIEPKDGVSGTLSWSGYAPWHDYAEQVTSAQIRGEVHASTCYCFFRDFKNMLSVDLSGLKTENVTTMRSMFDGCSGLTTLDLSNFNTQNVTTMYCMFSNCSGLTTLDLSNFNTKSVTDMTQMFYHCSGLTTLNLSNFDTQNVTNMSSMFTSCSGLTTLDLCNFNTHNVTDMSCMFFGCSGLTTLDLSNFNTHNVTDMSGMFFGCSGLTTLNLSNFDTQNVTKMYSMFFDCSSLTSLDLSNFDTQNVTSINYMFSGCFGLATLNLSNFNTMNVTEMNHVFAGCSNLASIISDNAIPSTLQAGTFSTLPTQQTCQLYVPGDAKEAYSTAAGWNELNLATAYGTIGSCVWSIDKDGKLVIEPIDGMAGVLNTWFNAPWHDYAEQVTSAQIKGEVHASTCYCFFRDFKNMVSADLSGLKTENVSDMRSMFDGCTGLTTLDLSNFNTQNVTTMYCMFSNCSGLTTLDLSNFNTKSVTDMTQMFYHCSGLTTLNLSNFDTQNVTKMSYMFTSCSGLTSLNLSNFNTQNVTTMRSMFDGCSGLTTLDLSNFDTQNVTTMYCMFSNCSGLTTLDLSNFNTKSVTDMTQMFYDCSGLTTLNLSNFDTQNVTKMSYMFSSCSGLTTLDLSNFNTQNVTNMSGMLYGCSGLTTLDLSNFNTHNVTDMSGMFFGCSGLTTLNLSNFDTKNVTKMYSMFFDCSSLTSLDLSNFDTQNVTSINYMFSGCFGLATLNLSNFNTMNVTEMNHVFVGCSNLASIISDNAIPSSLQTGTFSTLPTQQTCQLYVPMGSEPAYRAATGWNELALDRIVSGLSGTCKWTVDDKGVLTIEPADGITGTLGDAGDYQAWTKYGESIQSAVVSAGVTAARCDYFFSGMAALKSVDLKGLNTENVTNMHAMFYGCSGLESLDVSSLNTSKATDMGMMFDGCSMLSELDLKNFDTKNVTDMNAMLSDCSSLVSLDLSAFNTRNVTDMNAMFSGCSSLQTLNLTNFNASKVSDISFMFSGCNNLTTIISESPTPSPLKAGMFGTLPANTHPSLVVPMGSEPAYRAEAGWNELALNMIASGQSGTCIWTIDDEGTLVIAPVDGVSGTLADWDSEEAPWCKYSAHIKSARFEGVVSAATCARMFYMCDRLSGIDFTGFHSDNATSMYGMFGGCTSLTSIDLSSLNTTNVTNMQNMFSGCTNLKALDLRPLNTQNVTSMHSMFWNCSSLTSLDLSPLSTKNVTNMYGMFYDCTSLASLNLSGFNTQSVWEINKMFTGCSNLTTIISNNETPSPLKAGTFSSLEGGVTLQVPFATKKLYKAAEGWSEIGTIIDGTESLMFTLKYEVDGVLVKSESLVVGTAITPMEEPTKEGYTFGGWSEIPDEMPMNDVTITGSFTINQYKLSYIVDGELVKTETLDYQTVITPMVAPTKEGYTFGGWIEIPAVMPAKDVIVTASYSINQYKLNYIVDGEIVKTETLDYQAVITPIATTPTKEGYTFSGWSEIPELMPAEDVTVTGSFAINQYKLSYIVDGELVKTETLEYQTAITPMVAPTKDGYTFSGWSGMPEVMPAHDIMVYGTFTHDIQKPDNEGEIAVTNPDGKLDEIIEFKDEVKTLKIEGNVTDKDIETMKSMDKLLTVHWNSNTILPLSFRKGTNPNLIVYADDESKVEGGLENSVNVIVNGKARRIELTDNEPMIVPEAFEAQEIRYDRKFSMETEVNSSAGWMSIVLPFDSKTTLSEKRGLISPFGSSDESAFVHYWLAEATDGFKAATSIEANKPYIVAMPNNPMYIDYYNIDGKVTFLAENVTVHSTADAVATEMNEFSIMPSYEAVEKSDEVYALNKETVDIDGVEYKPGSVFVRNLRNVNPFECYLKPQTHNARMRKHVAIGEMNGSTGMQGVPSEGTGRLKVKVESHQLIITSDKAQTVSIFSVSGTLVRKLDIPAGTTTIGTLPDGVYVIDGKKVIVK